MASFPEIDDLNRLLVLVPTDLELDLASPRLLEQYSAKVCGFGAISSGIETSRLLASGHYQHIVLIGIAGTYDADVLPPGSACSFGSVACFGIGADEGEGYQGPRVLGQPQTYLKNKACFDELPLEALPSSGEGMLLTVCSAAGNDQQVGQRRKAFPQAIAEDMEAFSVALAGAKWGVPVSVIRGISNRAGDRDHTGWQIRSAMKAAVELLDSDVIQPNRK